MNKGTLIAIIVVIVLLVVGIVGYMISNSSYNTQNNNPSPNTNTQTNQNPNGPDFTPPPAPGNPSTPASHDIAISNFAFSPSALTINAGDSITWTNNDATSHSIVFDSSVVTSSGLLAQGGSFSQTFSTAGTYTYHCGIHPNMKGTITVQ